MTAPKRDLVQVAGERSGITVPSTRTQLRKEISRLAQRKLAATDRMAVRRWAASALRTDDELAQKMAELVKLSDLPPRRGN
ncbi:MAG: hypothetical protein ABW022_15710 [Actinoplanes sp.]